MREMTREWVGQCTFIGRPKTARECGSRGREMGSTLSARMLCGVQYGPRLCSMQALDGRRGEEERGTRYSGSKYIEYKI